ncbi:endonuclease/exonuclease/phosphatase family protein [Nocardioides sp. SR21]|uniref:endonuclease/exonuclease/phosphatase family protein n=1 Tax=Nocardioides sp. SR21 TaxID=2919501 RepID=UPI001FAB165B|nr:endonuclease/exonuclease/phosphatase family protein [Nocardioides sp. SR21]
MAGVVGGNVVDWRVASTAVEQQAVLAPEPTVALAVPPPPADPAPVRSAATLRLRPTPTAPPAAPERVEKRVVTLPTQPVVVPPAVAKAPAAPTPTSVSITQANLYQGMSAALFAQDLAAVASTEPDFITLNEAGHRGDAEIRPPGYASFRTTGSPYLAETPVLWRTDRWTQVDAGSRWLTTRKVKWGERAVNWVTLRSTAGQVLSVVSAHPAPTLRRTAGLLPVFMDGLAVLVRELRSRGPVLVGGDFNAGYHGPLWPGDALATAGLTSTYDAFGVPDGGTGDHGGHTIDYVFHTAGLTPTAQSTRELTSDHDAVLASFSLEG